MLIVVVFESLTGNTRMVAEAVARGVGDSDPGAVVSCGTTAQVGDEAAAADLLVVGAPTHFLGLPARRSRLLWVGSLRRQGGGVPGVALEQTAEGPGVREWLDDLPSAGGDRLAAAFDTRLRRPFSGAAARQVAGRLRRAGYRLVVPPAGFFVADMTGPLRPGELERARAWGAGLLAQRVT